MAAPRWPSGLLDPQTLGWRAFLIVIPVSFVGVLTILPASASVGPAVAAWLVASVLCTAAMGLVMALGFVVCRGVASVLVQCVLVYLFAFAAGAVRGLVVGAVFGSFDVADQVALMTRVLTSAFIYSMWLTLIGALVVASLAHRRRREQLLDELIMRELQERLLDTDRVLTGRHAAARQFTQSTDEVRGILDGAHASDDVDFEEVSRSIKRVVDERVRPLVHQMWESPSPPLADKGSWHAFARRAYLIRVPLAWAVCIYGVIATGAALASLSGMGEATFNWQTALIAAAIETGAVAAVIVIERIVRPTATMLSRSVSIAALLVLPLLTAGLATSRAVHGSIPVMALISLVVTGPVVVLAACATRVALDDRAQDLADLQSRIDRDEWGEQLLVLERRAAQIDMASSVHNSVQARLVAAAMQLQTAALDGDHERAATALRDARAALDMSLVNDERPAMSIAERLDSIVVAWRGITTVRMRCSPDVFDLPEAHIAVDAVEECVANASRHAGADEVAVDLARDGEDLVVAVTDNGTPLNDNAVHGLGTAWMSGISMGRLTRERLSDRNCVELRIPLIA